MTLRTIEMRSKLPAPTREVGWEEGHHCVACNRRIKREASLRWVHMVRGGFTILHPGDEDKYVEDAGEMGYHPIGSDCARRLGNEWVHPGSIIKLEGLA